MSCRLPLSALVPARSFELGSVPGDVERAIQGVGVDVAAEWRS